MNYLMDILASTTRGLLDSIRGSLVLFYLDKSIKEKASQKPFYKGNDMCKKHSNSPSKTYKSHEEKNIFYMNNSLFMIELKVNSVLWVILIRICGLREPKILKRTLQCCALNGGVFWASLLLFDIVLLPFLRNIVSLAMGNASSTGQIWFWIKMFLSWTFSAIWVVPLLLLCKIVNNLWFLDIADLAYRHSRGNFYMPRSMSYALADTFLSVLVQILFLVQSVFVCLLPSPFGQLFWLVHMCMLYSLYSFEYRWVSMGWELHQRLTYIENHWPYFIGFGLPLALFTSLPSSYIVSGCVFSILFPLFIVSGNEADLKHEVPHYFPLQLFRPVVAVSNTVLLKWVSQPRYS